MGLAVILQGLFLCNALSLIRRNLLSNNLQIANGKLPFVCVLLPLQFQIFRTRRSRAIGKPWSPPQRRNLLRGCIASSNMVLQRVLSPREKEPKSARRGRHNSAFAMTPPSGLSPDAAGNWAHWRLWCLKRLAGAAFWIPLEGAAGQVVAWPSKGGWSSLLGGSGALVVAAVGRGLAWGQADSVPLQGEKGCCAHAIPCFVWEAVAISLSRQILGSG